MERLVTSVNSHRFAQFCLNVLKPKPEPAPVNLTPVEKVQVPGPDRVIGLTNYKKWEEFKDTEESEEQKKAQEYIKTMCSQDHRKEIELYERPTKEKLIACAQFKTQGNDAFKQQNYSLAALFYRKGLLQLDYTFPDVKEEEKEFKELEIALHLNMGIAKYFLEELDECLTHVGQVLKQNPDHPKALYRKALVYYKRDLLTESRELVMKIIGENPKNQEARELLSEIEKKQGNYKIRQKQVFKAMLDSEEKKG
jgi:tetratricopeptide (TPR) repeat protein